MSISQAEFKMLIAALVVLVINILILVIYAEAVQVTPEQEQGIDIIMLSRGREREVLQAKLWKKYFKPNYKVQMFVLHTIDNQIKQHHEDDNKLFTSRIQTNLRDEQEIFLNIHHLIQPSSKNFTRSKKFIWISDLVVPIQKVAKSFFEYNKALGGSRFFSGFNADAILLNASTIYEKTIPVGYIDYEKIQKVKSWTAFIGHFLSSRHHVFTNANQDLLLPNPKNRAKTRESRELFQVAHISPDFAKDNKDQMNERIKEIWKEYLNEVF